MWIHSFHGDGTACNAAQEDVCVELGLEDLETGQEAMTCFLGYSSCCFVGLERLTTDMAGSRTTVAVALQSFGVCRFLVAPLRTSPVGFEGIAVPEINARYIYLMTSTVIGGQVPWSDPNSWLRVSFGENESRVLGTADWRTPSVAIGYTANATESEGLLRVPLPHEFRGPVFEAKMNVGTATTPTFSFRITKYVHGQTKFA